MPGIPLRHFQMFRPVGLMVQDRSFFPKGPLRGNRQNIRSFLLEHVRVILRGIRRNLRLQGSHIGKQFWVGKNNCLLFFLVHVNVSFTAKLLR